VANFALTLVHGPRWDDSLAFGEQHAWTEHAAFMRPGHRRIDPVRWPDR